jgi:hypothetical protein
MINKKDSIRKNKLLPPTLIYSMVNLWRIVRVSFTLSSIASGDLRRWRSSALSISKSIPVIFPTNSSCDLGNQMNKGVNSKIDK